MDASKHIFDTLQASGNRVTKPRQQVIAVLQKYHQPLTIQQIVAKVTVDEVSVYRTIALLRALHLVEEIMDKQGAHRFALVSEHHHHLVCQQCGHIAHIPCELGEKQSFPHHADFSKLITHEVTYYGLCRTCGTQ